MSKRIAYYSCLEPNVLIKNKKGEVLLKRKYKRKNNVIRLPYEPLRTKNKLLKINTVPVDYNLLDKFFMMYPPDRHNTPKKISLMKSTIETNKACIYPELGNVYFNPAFLDSLNNIVERKLVMFHEIGHLYFSSEIKCDLFAATIVYMLGHNKYMISKSAYFTLGNGDENYDRLNKLLDYLENLEENE